MGRRSLKKIPTTLDISPYITEVEKLPQPWDAAELFEADVPLEIEVGCGKGLFMATVSAKHPERNYLGIEVRGKYARFAASRLARDKRSNAKMVHGDALTVFHNMLPAECLAGVHVYFPDPWWKTRHHKRRVLNEPFMKDVQRVLAPGGLFHLWTDVEEYYTSSVELIDQVTQLIGPQAVTERPAEHDLDYHTHFERRTRLHGEAVYRTQYEKPSTQEK